MSFRSCQKVTVCLVRLLLLSPCTGQLATPLCKLQRASVSGFTRDGDILLGGTFAMHDAREYSPLTFTERPARISCQTFLPASFPWLQAMTFAIEEVNMKSSLLPNITLGFRIHDSCMVLERSLVGTLWMLTGEEVPTPNYLCWKNHPTMAIVGDATSTVSILMSRILSLYKHPQISYSASSPLLSDRNEFPSFFRTVPSDDYQSCGLAQLLLHFEWTWVGLLADDDDYGQYGIQLLREELVNAGACIAFCETIITGRADKNAFHIVQVIKKSSANAIAIFSNAASLAEVLDEMMEQNVTGKVLIATEGWSTSGFMFMEKYSEILSGTIGFEIYSGEIPGFEEYLTGLHPLRTTDDVFLQEFWEETFGCKLHYGKRRSMDVYSNDTLVCTGAEKLERLQVNPTGITSFGYPYKIYTAVYAIARSLHDLSICRMDGTSFDQRTCADIMSLQPWQLLQYIRKVNLQENGGRGKYFDEHGNPPAQYDIINLQQNHNGTLKPVKVGAYDSSAPPGETLKVNVNAVHWNTGATGGTKIPISVCSPMCPTGKRKVVREGQPICCFVCVPCPQGEIANRTDSIDCSISEMNTKEHLMGRGTGRSKKIKNI
ncbi:hypothetical protein NDU88_000606 [Pleurodeles waltl]|uniref:Uncharacterized protein n=1 Tax=Pleurodeles waltl TaxID=8319 RepID=A0AAV7KPC4_PLEWA|nr:hypothetical protein NDU88_000606 [Pleurodeles waltl]